MLPADILNNIHVKVSDLKADIASSKQGFELYRNSMENHKKDVLSKFSVLAKELEQAREENRTL